jgi:hypothetical protein
MRKAIINLSQGLTLNYSELSAPFVIKRLPLWPKPGEGWAPHPGIVPYNASVLGYQPGDEFIHSDTSGLLVVKRNNELIVRDLLRGEVATGRPEFVGNTPLGVVLPRTGWYRSRQSYIFPGAPGSTGINLRPLKAIPGNLEAGSYRVWALTYERLPTGLLFLWYSVLTATLDANGGLEIKLAEKPGQRVVRLYVQRLLGSWTPLTYLGELTGDEDTFLYTSHLQEGAAEEIAIAKAIGRHAAYYNGRYFYQSDKLTVLGRGAQDQTGGGPGGPPGNRPTSGFFLTYQDGLLISEVVENASPVKFAPFGEWDAGVETEQGLFVAVRVDGETHIYHTPSGRGYNAWSLIYKLNTPVQMRWAAASPSRVVFVADGQALVGNLSNYLSSAGWRQVTLPTSRPIKRLMWTSGNQFAAITDGELLLGGADGTNWEVKIPPASGDFFTFTEWKDFTYASRPGKFFILAARPLGGGDFFLRVFMFDGNTWSSHWPKVVMVLPPPINWDLVAGVVHRRFATIWSDGENLLGLGFGVKGGLYGSACGSVFHDLYEADWFTFFRADQFGSGCSISDFLKRAIVNPPARLWSSNDTDDYGTLHKQDGGIGGAFVRGGQYRRWLISYNTSTGNVEVYDPNPPVDIKGVPILLRDQSWQANYPENDYKYTGYAPGAILRSVPAFASVNHGDIVYAITSAFMRLGKNLVAQRFNLENVSAFTVRPLGVANENGNVAILIRNYRTLADPPNETLFVGQPPSFAQVNLGTAPGPLPPEYVYNGIRTDGIKVYYTNQYRTFVVNGANVQSYGVGGVSVVSDGSRWYVVGQTGIREITSSGLVSINNDAYVGAVDGSGAIYGVRASGTSLEVLEINTETWATTSLGTIPGTRFCGGYVINGVLTIATYDGNTLRVMFYDDSWRTAYSINTPHPVVGFIGSPIPSGGGGEAGGGSSSGAADSTYQIELPPNTIVWTDVGHINQTVPYAYQTFVPRTSTSVTAITEHPAGVMVFMENEAFIMTGRFTSLADTRVSLYPQAVGVDKRARITRVGSNLFVVWNGRLFVLGDGEVALLSKELTDDSPFVAIAYDPVHSMIVARKENGRTYRYDTMRKVWFDDIDGTLDLVQLADGVLYVRRYIDDSLGEQIGLFRLARENERVSNNPLYYRPRPEVWIESARMHIVGNAIDLTPVKRLRAIYLQMRSEGPPNPYIEVYNEAGALVAGGDMIPTLTGNTFGIARYHFRFPPVVTFAPERIAISFAGVKFILANDIEVHYEARERRI